MDDKPDIQEKPEEHLPDEDGTVLIYGHVRITDLQSGEVLVTTRS